MPARDLLLGQVEDMAEKATDRGAEDVQNAQGGHHVDSLILKPDATRRQTGFVHRANPDRMMESPRRIRQLRG